MQHVVIGNVMHTSADAIYGARHVALKAGLPIEVPALTVNRLCGSGIQAAVSAAQLIQLEEADVVLAGGIENMSQAPHVIRGLRSGLRLGQGALADSLMGGTDRLVLRLRDGADRRELRRRSTASPGKIRMNTRCAVSSWPIARGPRAASPTKSCRSKSRPGRAGNWSAATTTCARTPRSKGSPGLTPVFKRDGTVTAGNASGIVDGGAALVLASAGAVSRYGLSPIGRLIGWASVGVEPELMGMGPAPATRRVLERTGLTLSDIDLIEINEAFAGQYLAVEKELGLDRDKVNVNGGAIALGHPLGMSGTRLLLTVLLELRRRGRRRGLAAACIGGGQGIAAIVEAL